MLIQSMDLTSILKVVGLNCMKIQFSLMCVMNQLSVLVILFDVVVLSVHALIVARSEFHYLHSAVRHCTLRCDNSTAFGGPVVPLENMIIAGSFNC